MPENTIQFTATIHRILQCCLETLRFTVGSFQHVLRKASGTQLTGRTLTAGKLLAPKEGHLKAGLWPSQLILLQVIKLHITEVNVILHRKLTILAIPGLPGSDGREGTTPYGCCGATPER